MSCVWVHGNVVNPVQLLCTSKSGYFIENKYLHVQISYFITVFILSNMLAAIVSLGINGLSKFSSFNFKNGGEF